MRDSAVGLDLPRESRDGVCAYKPLSVVGGVMEGPFAKSKYFF